MKKFLFIMAMVLLTGFAYAQKPLGDTVNNATASPCSSPGFIDQQPQNYTACVGTNAMFICVGLGVTGHLHSAKQWDQSLDGGITWTEIPGTHAGLTGYITQPPNYQYYDTLRINNVTLAMSGTKYRCVFRCGPVTSLPATLTVIQPAPIVITAHPSDVGPVCSGAAVNFTVVATGASISYQWQVSTNGGSTYTDIAGANASQLHFDAVTKLMNTNKYRCVLSSSCASGQTTNPATLLVDQNSAEVTVQPTNQPGCSTNNTATFSLTASGQSLYYQWQKKSIYFSVYADITGATNPTLTLTNITATDNNNQNRYRCKISSTCPTPTYSNEVNATVYPEPIIITQPSNLQSCAGKNTNFSVKVSGIFDVNLLTAQWEQSADGGLTFTNATGTNSITAYAGNSNVTYQLVQPITAAMDNYKFRLHLFNPCNSKYSDAVLLQLNIPIAITSQPQSVSICSGASTQFSIGVSGSVTNYFWETTYNFPGTGFTTISYDNPFIISNATPNMNHWDFRCIVGSTCSAGPSLISDTVILTILSTPIINDTCKSAPCMNCGVNISTLYNTSPYPIVLWSTPTPSNATMGYYKLKVTNGLGCSDSANIWVFTTDSNIIRSCSDFSIVTINSNITGSSYQWQVRKSSVGSFLNIAGETSATITRSPIIANASYNDQYRCIVNGTDTSNISTIRIGNVWTGEVDSDWFNKLNWSCRSLPETNTDAYIYGNNPHYPVLNQDVYCRSLTIYSGGSITINPPHRIVLSGH
jgi:hypothetical protein